MVKYLKEVYEIPNPHFSKELITEVVGNDYLKAVDDLTRSMRLDLDIAVRTAIQQAADVYRTEAKVVMSEIKHMALTGRLVLCSPFTESVIEDKRCSFILSNNEQMDNRMVVLTKIDPFTIGKYSAGFFAPEDGKVGLRLAVEFDFSDVQGGATYTINDGYDQ